MKKVTGILMAATLALSVLMTGCGKSDDGKTSTAGASANQTESQAGSQTEENTKASDWKGGEISVLTREDGSGTRGAFIELFGIEQKNEAGEKVDMTIETAEVTNSTSVMISTIAGNEQALGYISLGSLSSDVKALKVDGVEASVENVKNGTYAVARPFNICTKEEISDAAQDFINYIMSAEGQKVIEDNGYVSVGDAPAYEASGASGDISVAGSSSVTPVMEKLKEAYAAVNPDVNISIQQSDSSTGISSTIEGICDIGMASRDLKDEELAEGVAPTTIAMDGIAVIVNNANPLEEISSDDVLKIYTGEITDWEEIGQ